MGLRNPKEDIQIPNLESLKPLQWHKLECELVTPLYGGGVKAATVDLKMPIRASAIRGQLRFWWRLLAKHKWKLGNTKAIQNAEFALFGGMGDDDGGRASKVFLKVSDIKKNTLKQERWAEYRPNARGRGTLYPENWANVPYALFPAQGRTQENPQEEPHNLIREGLEWSLFIAFSSDITNDQKKQFWDCIRWWSSFGGVGARTRRGLGAIKITSDMITVVTPQEVEEIGCKLTLRLANNAYLAWENAISRMQRFRQIGVGRKSYDTRSFWPEPDAIRYYTGQSLPRHSIRLTQGDIFPRAEFGLPIIFKFKDGGDNKNTDPRTTTLNVKYKENGKDELLRFSSPIILRAYFHPDGRWYSAALCLPNHLSNILSLNENIKLQLDDKYVECWDESKVGDVKPLQDRGGVLSPLDAFLKYFAV